VSGWRRERKDKMITRKIPSWIANWIIGHFLGLPLHDYGCTLKAYRREFLESVNLYGEMHRFIPVYAKWAGARVTSWSSRTTLDAKADRNTACSGRSRFCSTSRP